MYNVVGKSLMGQKAMHIEWKNWCKNWSHGSAPGSLLPHKLLKSSIKSGLLHKSCSGTWCPEKYLLMGLWWWVFQKWTTTWYLCSIPLPPLPAATGHGLKTGISTSVPTGYCCFFSCSFATLYNPVFKGHLLQIDTS